MILSTQCFTQGESVEIVEDKKLLEMRQSDE